MAKFSAHGTRVDTFVSKNSGRIYTYMSDQAILTQFRYSDGKISTPTIWTRKGMVLPEEWESFKAANQA